MKRYSLIGTLIHGLAIFMCAAGIVLWVYGLVCGTCSARLCVWGGLVLFLLSFFAYGFGTIVEAACWYLKEKDEKIKG